MDVLKYFSYYSQKMMISLYYFDPPVTIFWRYRLSDMHFLCPNDKKANRIHIHQGHIIKCKHLLLKEEDSEIEKVWTIIGKERKGALGAEQSNEASVYL
jgi:hypothetical protein